MNTIATFDNTVSVLVKAYLEGTLYKGSCAACAVGNICAAAQGVEVDPSDISPNGWFDHDFGPMWQHLFITRPSGSQERAYQEEGFQEDETCNLLGVEQIQSTGYTTEQLARVELAFESTQRGYTDEAAFAGLMAVVDVLADIHGIDLTTATAAKALFVKAI